MDVTSHLRKAEEAARRKQFRHAVRLYWQVLGFKPDHGEARRALRETLSRQAEYRPVNRWLARLSGLPHLVSLALALASKRPDRVAMACERYLAVDPEHSGMTMRLGDALAQAGYLNSAVAVYEFLGEVGRGGPAGSSGGSSRGRAAGKATGQGVRAAALREAGAAHYRLSHVDRALECLESCLELDPHDAQADKLRKNVAAESALSSGGYAKAGSSRDLMRDRDGVERSERAARLHRTEDEIAEEIADLEQKLEQDSQDARSRRRLVELFTRCGKHERALDVVESGLSLRPDSQDLLDLRGEIRMAVYQREISKLRQRLSAAAAGDSPGGGDEGEGGESRVSHVDDPLADVRVDLADLEAEALAFEVEEFSRRVTARPTELEPWYQLGVRHLRGRRIDPAIEAFQHSVRDPRRRVDSLSRLSRCFYHKGLYELAERQLVEALGSLPSSSDRGKEALYNLGLIAEKDGRVADAKAYYARIYEVDIGYRDIACKIETLTNQERTAGDSDR